MSVASANIREWKNSFAPVNRIPLDILSLIPTHLASQRDRFYAASVCRHWRGALLKYGALWTQLFLRKGEEYVSTLLDRAKGSALDVVTCRNAPDGALALIFPRARQIRCLELQYVAWKEILTFSELNSARLPLLRALKIIYLEAFNPDDQHIIPTLSSQPFFRGSPNLKEFIFHSARFRYLDLFVFPNLTTFEMSTNPSGEPSASHLFDFLKSSPMLRTVKLKINSEIVLDGVPQGMVVTLPDVETFSLYMRSDTVVGTYDIASHLLCPRARDTSLIRAIGDASVNYFLEMSPRLVMWEKIVHQHATCPMEEATLEVKRKEYDAIRCSLVFRSADAAVLKLGFDIVETGEEEEELAMTFEEMGWEIFSQALATIRDYPLLSHIKRLHIKHRSAVPDVHRWAEDVGELFSCLGPLDKLTIDGCDLQIFLAAFLEDPDFSDLEETITFPWIKDLTILHPYMSWDEAGCMEAIVGLAESQDALGIPFERVAVRMWYLPTGMVEELEQWVNVVECCKEWDQEL